MRTSQWPMPPSGRVMRSITFASNTFSRNSMSFATPVTARYGVTV